MNVYICLSHSAFYLPYQTALIRAHVDDPHVIVLQDEAYPAASLEECRQLGADEAHALPAFPSRGFSRHRLILSWAIEHSEAKTLILHGDMLPLQPLGKITAAHVAGTGGARDGRGMFVFRWLYVDEEGRAAYDARSQSFPADLCEFKRWDFLPQEHFPQIVAAGYDPLWKMEWCEPGMLHCQHMSQPVPQAKQDFICDLLGELDLPRVRAESSPANEEARREGICHECDKWDRTRSGCSLLKKCERRQLTRALWRRQKPDGCRLRRWLLAAEPRPACATCDLPDPINEQPTWAPKQWAFQEDVRQRHVAGLAEICGRPIEPPHNLAGDGIVYAGDGRYWPMIVVGVRLLRELGCSMPVQVWTRDAIGKTELDDCEVQLIDLDPFEQSHPARCNRAYSMKSYAMAHSGFARALWLDADAYCVADPAPLFAALDAAPYVFWSTGNNYYPTYDTHWTGVAQDAGGMELQGGQYLIDFRRYWHELQIARWIDDHADYFWRHNKFHDEAAWRIAIAALGSRFLRLNYRWAGPIMVSGWQGTDYICHRIRSSTKLIVGGTPRKSSQAPMEARLFELFAEVDPAYRSRFKQWLASERAARAPRMLRARRRAELARR